ncbi:MAG TPA: FIST N-terminal domain-containing protein [Phycisphaerae bacterium]|nr:FIST N-terminal domain-containing protein [Phycisphaerae bacterium]
MNIRATISTNSDTEAAVDEVCQGAVGMAPDLVLLFASHHHAEEIESLVPVLWERIGPRNLIGCLADGVIGPSHEVERAPAMALWAAKMPGVRVLPFILDQQDIERFESSEDWLDRIGIAPGEKPGFLVLPEPFSIDAERCLERLDELFPGCTIVGGLASGGTGPRQNRIFLDDQVLRQGLAGVSLCGPVSICPVVSQGCRPVGEPFVVTKAEQYVIQELRGKPAMEVLRDVFSNADPADRALMQKGIHVGRVVDERLHNFGRGDFLIRNLMGVVGETGLAINSLVRPGQTIQFHVRDSKTATEEMRSLLAGTVAGMTPPPAGGLLFTCNGRGAGMFGAPDHDIRLVNSVTKGCPIAGFFAQGEIGPIGHKTFIHGFSSSLVLFHDASNSE